MSLRRHRFVHPDGDLGVIWLVMKAPVSASTEQIAALAETLRGPNNRPVQPRNARVVLR